MSAETKPLGFWSCWSLSVGTMIGSGIFMLPAVLAPYGALSFGGWLISAAGTILLALVIGRLAARTHKSGGPYVYVRDAFGDFPGFLMAWGYWASYWIAVPTIAIAFVGYLTVFIPGLSANPFAQALIALALLWGVTLINIRGLREASSVQIVMTMLKIAPLILIAGFALFAGQSSNLPPFNPSGEPIFAVLAATTLITSWAFAGFEAGCIPAGAVRDCQRIVPRAIIAGTISVALIYLASTFAVMTLLPPETLAASTAPFADAARGLGAWGPSVIAAGALISTAGALNGTIFATGQIPMAVAMDKLAPRALAGVNSGGAPTTALIVGATLGSVLLALNYTRGLVGAFTFLIMLSTLAVLVPLLVCVIADLRHSWKSARGWAAVALLAGLFTIFAIVGSGLEIIGWTILLFAAGAPLYWLNRRRLAVPAS